jgi:hypothetical protein
VIIGFTLASIGTLLYSIIPFHHWVITASKPSLSEKDKNKIHFSKSIVISIVSPLLTASKGFLPLWLESTYIVESRFLFCLPIIILIGHLYSPLNKGTSTPPLLPLLLGMYIFFTPILGLTYLISFLVFTFVCNSNPLGHFLSIFAHFALFWAIGLPIHIYTTNIAILCSILILQRHHYIALFKGRPHTLLDSYKHRHQSTKN